MATPRYQFLPWSRRGLAAEVAAVDDRDGVPLPARASFGVSLTVSNIGARGVMLTLYGPGDVVGVDPRLIVRVDPAPGSTDVEPNYCPAIEFDPPDFPWLFTPARADASERLRPWCVLIVVDTEVVAAPALVRGALLPTITVPRAAVATELPRLSESWAWGHAQLLTESAAAAELRSELTSSPDLNLSRLIAPRRLAAGRRYAACLVPAFEVGRLRGVGGTPAEDATLEPAWSDADGPDVVLPVYFHWEFATGPDGDFETLARALQPHQCDPEAVGTEPMYLGHAAPEVPSLGLPEAEQTTRMDAVLRVPSAAAATLDDIGPGVREWLRATLDEPERRLAEGDGLGTRVLGPPLHGGEAIRRHTVPEEEPVWFRELNLDPRARAAAGLGARVVAANQEEFMRACWDQIGDVLAANELLSRGRLALEGLRRIHRRHLAPLDAGRLAAVAAPLLDRARAGTGSARRTIARSSVPDAAVSAVMRRRTSAQNPVRKRLARRMQAAPDRPHVVTMLAAGWPAVDPADFIPDGIVRSEALDRIDTRPAAGTRLTLAAHGLALEVSDTDFAAMRERYRALRPDALVIGPREHLDRTGLVTATAIAELVAAAPAAPDRPQLVRDALRVAAARAEGAGAAGGGQPGVVHVLGGVAVPDRSIPPLERDTIVLRRFETARVEATAVLHLDAPTPQPRLVPLPLDDLAGALRAGTEPAVTVPRRLRAMISASADAAIDAVPGLRIPDTFDRVMAAPTIETPLHRLLAAHDRERFLPSVERIPADSITLLETNPRFVAAFLVGANHELNRELLWRRYPSDGRATVLRTFWAWSDGQPDIAPIHRWGAGTALAAQARGGPGGQLVLLLRGRLLWRYPNAVIYAWRSENRKLKPAPRVGVDLKAPVFAGRLDPDVSFAGFDLTDAAIADGDGWFFVIQEQPTEPRFGLDEAAAGVAPALPGTWAAASWADVGVAPGGYIRLEGNPLAGHEIGGVRFGRDSAHLAALMLQKPARVAIHASTLLQA